MDAAEKADLGAGMLRAALSPRQDTLSGAMSAEKVALDGYRAVMEGRTLAFSGAHNWMVAQSTRFVPRKMVTAISRWVAEKVE